MHDESSPRPSELLRMPAPLVRHQETTLEISHREKTLLIQLVAEDSFPRLTYSTLYKLKAQLVALRDDANLSAAVITGSHICFCAGAEIAELGALRGEQALRFAELGQSVTSAIERSEKPVIAAIRGYCMGGGFDLALACQMRIAAPDSVFAHRGAALGIMTGWGATQRMMRVGGPGGRRVVTELMTTGRSITAQEAHSLRLINHIAPKDSVVDAAVSLASRAKSSTDLPL